MSTKEHVIYVLLLNIRRPYYNSLTSIDGVGDSCNDVTIPRLVIINPHRIANTPLPNITVCAAQSDAIAKKERVEGSFGNIYCLIVINII